MKKHENLKQVLEILMTVEEGLRKNGRLENEYDDQPKTVFEWLEELELIEEDEENGWTTRNMELVAELLERAEVETE